VTGQPVPSAAWEAPGDLGRRAPNMSFEGHPSGVSSGTLQRFRPSGPTDRHDGHRLRDRPFRARSSVWRRRHAGSEHGCVTCTVRARDVVAGCVGLRVHNAGGCDACTRDLHGNRVPRGGNTASEDAGHRIPGFSAASFPMVLRTSVREGPPPGRGLLRRGGIEPAGFWFGTATKRDSSELIELAATSARLVRRDRLRWADEMTCRGAPAETSGPSLARARGVLKKGHGFGRAPDATPRG
jgi:hypothetical protein